VKSQQDWIAVGGAIALGLNVPGAVQANEPEFDFVLDNPTTAEQKMPEHVLALEALAPVREPASGTTAEQDLGANTERQFTSAIANEYLAVDRVTPSELANFQRVDFAIRPSIVAPNRCSQNSRGSQCSRFHQSRHISFRL